LGNGSSVKWDGSGKELSISEEGGKWVEICHNRLEMANQRFHPTTFPLLSHFLPVSRLKNPPLTKKWWRVGGHRIEGTICCPMCDSVHSMQG